METKKMKSSEALGVTFNGSVTFNGPMFDIHDNAHVHIGVTDKKPSAQKPAKGAAEAASSFAAAVYNKEKAPEVIGRIRQLMEGKAKPQDVVMPVAAAQVAGVIRRPTWEEFKGEFGGVCAKSTFSRNTNTAQLVYQGEIFDAMVEEFRQFLT